MGFLDVLPASVRHSILVAAGIVVSALIQWIQTDYTNWGLSPQVVGLLGFAIPMAVNALTPITRQYGVGSADTSFDPVVEPDVFPEH
jgi:hypothetical protein